MAEKSLFFNALPNNDYPTGYDRNYNADDLSDWLAAMLETGVVKTNTVNNEPTGLKVVATTGMTLNLNMGRAAILGKGYINNSTKELTVATAPTTATRYDYVVLKYDNNVSRRSIVAEIRTGTGSVPTVSNLNRSGNVYELMLCYIAVGVGTTSISQSNITDKRGDETLCPWFTAVKGYANYYDAIVQNYESVVTMAATGTVAITNLPSRLYNSIYSVIEVYTNGIKEPTTAYTVSNSGGYIVVTFATQRSGGAKITVSLGNYIDGEGLSTAINSYNEWVQDVEDLKTGSEYTYVCNGTNDNVQISTLVRTYLGGGTDNGSVVFKIVGTIGMSTPVGGSGTSASPYFWFNFDQASNRKAIVDFTTCTPINPTVSNGTSNVIFYSNSGLDIIGANVVVNNTAANTIIRVTNTNSGVVYFEKCRFWLTGYQDSLIAYRGTFTNCRGSVANMVNNSYCFLPSTSGIVKVVGGEYYAYTGDVNRQSAIVGQSGAEAVSILYGVNAPTVGRSGYYQTNSLIQFTGGGILNCTDLISELPLLVTTGISNIRGTIAKSKPTNA